MYSNIQSQLSTTPKTMKKTIIRRSPKANTQTDTDNSIHPLLKRIYHARGLSHQGNERELSSLPRPDGLKGVDKAVQRLHQALVQGEKIVIVGDFDADGATSTTLACQALEAMGAKQVGFVVPNRFDYGYGLTPEIVEVVAQQQPDVIITVDNGISSIDGVQVANEKNIDVIITDHHLPGSVLPNALAIVNPNQPSCEFESKAIAGVGVIFYVMLALRAYLQQQNWFEQRGIALPNMAQFLDLVALGTVADVVPLDAVNRTLVYQGLQRIRAGQCRAGIKALLTIAKRDLKYIEAQDMGFAVGPRLNAAGRLDDISLGIACLMAKDANSAHDMASELDGLNQDRRQIEGAMQQEAQQHIDAMALDEANLPPVICLYHPQWHQGVIGIVAGRIKEKYHRPVVAFAPSEVAFAPADVAISPSEQDEGMELKGSARSIEGVHIRDLLDRVATTHPNLINKFGGHAMAAGLAIHANQFEAFQQALNTVATDWIDAKAFDAVIMTDGELSPSEFNIYAAQALADGGPWGQQCPEPTFDGEFLLVHQRVVGEKHIKLTVSPVGDPQQIIDGIAFNADLSLWQGEPAKIKLVFSLSINRYRGRESVQLMVKHAEAL